MSPSVGGGVGGNSDCGGGGAVSGGTGGGGSVGSSGGGAGAGGAGVVSVERRYQFSSLPALTPPLNK